MFKTLSDMFLDPVKYGNPIQYMQVRWCGGAGLQVVCG